MWQEAAFFRVISRYDTFGVYALYHQESDVNPNTKCHDVRGSAAVGVKANSVPAPQNRRDCPALRATQAVR